MRKKRGELKNYSERDVMNQNKKKKERRKNGGNLKQKKLEGLYRGKRMGY